MSNLNTILSKSKRTLILGTKWIQYIYKQPHKSVGLRDFRDWVRTTGTNMPLVHYKIPWLPFPVIRWLQNYLKSDMEVFEWGSGASTLFFANQVRKVVSIEYDRLWFTQIKQLTAAYSNVYLNFIPPELIAHHNELSSAELAFYQCDDSRFIDQIFVNYVNSILDYPNASFDVILIDGRARMACLYMALQKIKDTGVILLDNAERTEYRISDVIAQTNWQIISITGPTPANIWPVFGTTKIITKNIAI